MSKLDVDRIMRDEIKKLKPYIPGKPIAEVKAEYGLDRVIKLASNENPLGVSKSVQDVIKKESANVYRYPDGGCRLIKKELSKKLNISEDMLLFGNGSDGLLKVIAETFLKNEQEVIISNPTFVEYIFIANMMGAHLIRIFMDNYKQNLNAMLEATTRKTRMIFLTGPHNPAGTIYTKEEFEDFMNDIPDNVIVIVDEAYYEYIKSEDYPDVIEYIKNDYPIILLRTFSKAYALAGLRLGYAIASPEIIKPMSMVRDPFNVNRLAQEAARAAINDNEFLQKTIEINEKGKEYLYSELDKRDIGYVSTEANFILINMKMDSMRIFNKLLRKGIIIRPGKPLGYPEHIRVTVGLPEENKIFINSIDKLMTE